MATMRDCSTARAITNESDTLEHPTRRRVAPIPSLCNHRQPGYGVTARPLDWRLRRIAALPYSLYKAFAEFIEHE
jgi:hypothetical protein